MLGILTRNITVSYARRVAIVTGLFHCFRLLTGAITVIFFLKSGLALSELAILQMIFSSTVLIVSYPIGILCDRHGGKYFAYAACLIIACFYLLCTFSPNLKVLIFAHFLNAIGLSFIGCASSVWVVSLIEDEKPQSKNYINYLGHLCGEIESIGGIISGVLGALLVYQFQGKGYVYVFYATSTLMLALSFVVLSIPDSHGNRKTTKIKKITELIKLNIEQVLHKKEIMFFLLTSSAMVVLSQPIYHFWQPYFVGFDIAKNFDESIILGLCFALFSLAKYIFNSYVKGMLIKNDNIDLIKMGIILTAIIIPLFYCVAINKHSFFLACILFCSLHGSLSLVSRIIGGQYLKTSSAKSTASVMSLSEVCGRILTIIYFIFLHKALEYISVREVFYISCVISFVILAGLVLWRNEISKTKALVYNN